MEPTLSKEHDGTWSSTPKRLYVSGRGRLLAFSGPTSLGHFAPLGAGALRVIERSGLLGEARQCMRVEARIRGLFLKHKKTGNPLASGPCLRGLLLCHAQKTCGVKLSWWPQKRPPNPCLRNTNCSPHFQRVRNIVSVYVNFGRAS